MILVTGATGHVGGELVRRLTAAGHPVRATTRRPSEARLPSGAEAVYGDADDPSTLSAAFTDASGAFLMSAQGVGTTPPGPTPDLALALALAEAAARAGVRRVVKLSVLDGGTGTDVIARWHAAAEAAVTSHDWTWTLLRPGRFMSNALQWTAQLRSGDTVSLPFADRPAASIDPADVAEIAARALTTHSTEHAGGTYELSGPQSLTPLDELALLGETLGRDLHAVGLPPEAARSSMRRYGFPPEVINAIMHRTLESDRGAEVLPTVEKVLGRPARTFGEWARAHTGAFEG
ncbi:NAD(P)H-binding protein [Streptomyces sp. NPDC005799]|uniref:NAD(P)H-binding protein n=1 Tax=Streptomyces sp. NPDC005799 TaxID=3154678 RepID=UPI0033C34444